MIEKGLRTVGASPRSGAPPRRAVRSLAAGLQALASLATAVAALAPASASAADACPNAALRALQGVEQVAECRAFEQVSPVDKHGIGVNSRSTVQSAPAAGAVSFSAPGAFAGAPASLAVTRYRALRGTDGWVTVPTDPPQRNLDTRVTDPTTWLSPDLSTAIGVSALALAPGATDGAANVYRVNVGGGVWQTMFGDPDPTSMLAGEFGYGVGSQTYPIVGASDDLQHVLIQVTAKLTPDAAAGRMQVYEWDAGQLRLASVLPDGSLPPRMAYASNNHSVRQRAISADGSRVLFRSAIAVQQEGALYLREGGHTRLVSHTQVTGGDPSVPRAALEVGASADLSTVYFSSGSVLTDDAQSGFTNLYRYDAGSGQVSVVQAGAPYADLAVKPERLLWVSDDGERMYFTARAKLDDRAAAGVEQLYLLDHGRIEFVSGFGSSGMSTFAASPDGAFATFSSNGDGSGANSTSSDCGVHAVYSVPPGTCLEVYHVDVAAGTTRCVSCRSAGQPSRGHAGPGTPAGGIAYYSPRTVTADGTVYFDTPNPLDPADVNHRRDVYAWKPGDPHPRLVTSGSVDADSELSDVSRDGTDVYFLTTGRLVAQDDDAARDLYTARRDGGLWSQQQGAGDVPADCQGAACQGPAAVPPALAVAGSSSFAGLGDVAPVRAPRASLSLATPRVPARVAAVLTVKVNGPGTVRVSGASIRRATRSVARAGRYRVRLSLTGTARRRLVRTRALRAGVTVVFTSKSGTTVRRRVVLRFAAPAMPTTTRKGGR